MKLNIAKTDTKTIEKALAAVNGKARANVVTTAEEVRSVAEQAETALAELGLPKSHRAGATAIHVSGKGLPNAYKYQATATELTLLRGSRNWYITGIERTVAYPGDTGRATKVSVSSEQAIQAAEATRRRLGVEIAAGATSAIRD